MGRGRSRLAGVVIVAIGILPGGCARAPEPQEIMDTLSYAVLAPDLTCAELRDWFEVDYLPLVDYPDECGLDFEEATVPTARGESLRVWYIPADDDRGTVIVSPGAVGSLPCFLFITELLNERGWSVVMYEYQGFGQSTGEPDLTSLRPDLSAVVDWTLTRTGREQVTLFSMSLGSIPSVAVAVERPEAINGVVLDSPVAMGAELDRFNFVLSSRARAAIVQFDPTLISEDIMDQMSRPLLVYLHEADIVTPPESVELLYDLASGPKELVRFVGLEHSVGQFYSTDEYMAHLEDFLAQIWEGAAATE